MVRRADVRLRNHKQFNVITYPAFTAKQLVDLARKNIGDQQDRIARQRELVAKYERDHDVARLSGARLALERMHFGVFSDARSPKWSRKLVIRGPRPNPSSGQLFVPVHSC